MITRQEIIDLFKLFDSHQIKYYLLRPLDLITKVKDIDLVVPKDEFIRLIKVLSNHGYELYLRPPNANESVQLKANGILLDIKFCLSFLPNKTLLLDAPLEYSSVKFYNESVIVPKVLDITLFTYWTFHLLLDKSDPRHSSTYLLYKSFYSETWSDLIQAEEFNEFLKMISQSQYDNARKVVFRFFENGMFLSDHKKLGELAVVIIKRSWLLKMAYWRDKIKYGIHRRIKQFNTFKKIGKVADQRW
jgi:hypothetical protein